MSIKVILVDDHAVVRAGFKMLLSVDDSIEVIDEAERGEQAISTYLEQKPDVLVMDLSMPGIGGLEAIKRIIAQDKSAKILVFSVNDESVYVERAIAAGARRNRNILHFILILPNWSTTQIPHIWRFGNADSYNSTL